MYTKRSTRSPFQNGQSRQSRYHRTAFESIAPRMMHQISRLGQELLESRPARTAIPLGNFSLKHELMDEHRVERATAHSFERQAVPFIRFLSHIRQILIYGQGERRAGLMKAFSKREREVLSGPMSDQELARAIRQIRYSAFAADTLKNSAKPLRSTDQTGSIERGESSKLPANE
jgi:hypothetical protein